MGYKAMATVGVGFSVIGNKLQCTTVKSNAADYQENMQCTHIERHITLPSLCWMPPRFFTSGHLAMEHGAAGSEIAVSSGM